MGCNCVCDDSEKDFQILSNNKYLIMENKLKNKHNKKDVRIKSVIDDYKQLKKKSKKMKIKIKSKKSVKSGAKNLQSRSPKGVINTIKILHYNSNSKNKLSERTVKILTNIGNRTTRDKTYRSSNSSISNDKISENKKDIKDYIHSDLNKNRVFKNKSENKTKKIHDEITEEKILKKDVENIQYISDLTKESYSYFYLDNTFTVFNSIDNILYLIYGTINKSIISCNLLEDKKVIEIKNAHKELITNFRYYLDKKNKRDLVISLSYDNNIKLWNINNWECLSDIEEINKNGYLLSACFLHDNNNYYIITSNYSDNSELLKVFDLNGNKVKELKNSGDDASFIDTYYDIKLNKNYIVTGNIGYVKSYDYIEEKLYHEYRENDLEDHCSIIIFDKDEIIKMIESSGDGNIRIWNFHTGELLQKLTITKKRLFGMCLWDDEYLFVGCEDKTIKLIEIKSGEIINNLIGYNKVILTIKKIMHPKYGKCLLSQGNYNNQIKLWANKN